MTKIINVGEGAGNSYIFRSGVRLQVTPEGDCREATFIARGNGINLNPLDAVQINVNGVPTFYGEVRVGGNPYDLDGHQFTIRSMALRLKEVVLPQGWSAPKQAAHLTIQSMIDAVLPQLGGAITSTNISNLGFDCRAVVNANQQNPYALLEQIASDGEGLGVKVRFGVNASGQFFCRPAKSDATQLTHGMLTGATHWVAPVAEAPVTAVLWYVAKKPDGTWLTHLSQAPEAAVYGVRVKPVSPTSSSGLWLPVSGTWQAASTDKDGKWIYTPLPSSAVSALTDHAFVDFAAIIGAGPLRLVFTPSSPVVRYTVRASAESEAGVENVAAGYAPSLPVGSDPGVWLYSRSSLGQLAEAIYLESGTSTAPAWVGNVSWGNAVGTEPAPQNTLSATEFRPERLDTALLDRLAKFHYNIPATAPADIEIKGFSQARTGLVTYNGWQSPVDAWEIRVSAARGVNVGVLAGQADDPAKLAQAELIKARDQRAVITAITTQEG